MYDAFVECDIFLEGKFHIEWNYQASTPISFNLFLIDLVEIISTRAGIQVEFIQQSCDMDS